MLFFPRLLHRRLHPENRATLTRGKGVGCTYSVHPGEQGSWTWGRTRARPRGLVPTRIRHAVEQNFAASRGFFQLMQGFRRSGLTCRRGSHRRGDDPGCPRATAKHRRASGLRVSSPRRYSEPSSPRACS